MPDGWLDTRFSCRHCKKEVKLRDVKDWLKLSHIKPRAIGGDIESNCMYFCSYACVTTWIHERRDVVFARLEAQMRDHLWLEEEQAAQVRSRAK